MSPHDIRGTRYKPVASVGFCNGDTLRVDGTRYYVKAVTRTGLIRLVNPDESQTEWGAAALEKYLRMADEVTIEYA